MFSLLHCIRSQPVWPDSPCPSGQHVQQGAVFTGEGKGREGQTPLQPKARGDKGMLRCSITRYPGHFPVVCLNTSAAGVEGSHAPLTVRFALFSSFSSLQKAPGPCWICSCNCLQKVFSGAGWKRLSWRVGGRHRERGGEMQGVGSWEGPCCMCGQCCCPEQVLKESTGIKSMHGDFFFPSRDLILLWNLFQLSWKNQVEQGRLQQANMAMPLTSVFKNCEKKEVVSIVTVQLGNWLVKEVKYHRICFTWWTSENDWERELRLRESKISGCKCYLGAWVHFRFIFFFFLNEL